MKFLEKVEIRNSSVAVPGTLPTRFGKFEVSVSSVKEDLAGSAIADNLKG
jgi:hypothetical protein